MRFTERKRLTSGVNPLMKRAFRTAILSLTFAIAPQAPSTWTTAQATPVETSSTSDPLRPHAESKNFNGRYGYVLMNAKTGEILEKRDADHPFIPASLAKIPTLSMAMNALGMKHRFETRVLADGQIEQGVLYGNLHLVGSGDPTLKTRDLKALSDTLAQQGITRITGLISTSTFGEAAVSERK